MMKKAFQYLLTINIIGIILYSCASVGRLEGGDKDEYPPVFLGSTPQMSELNVKKRKITLQFDEFIKLDKPAEKIVISPPQKLPPEVKARGKKVVVTLEDTLKANTTYTISFSDAIKDNNEGNALDNFLFTFSTGNKLDTMAMGGYVLDAHTLEPVKNIITGLHTNLADSAFLKIEFPKVGMTNGKGEFTILGIDSAKYHCFALEDKDKSYTFNQPSERIAFSDSVYIPYGKPDVRMDTIWVDSTTVDTIIKVNFTHYYPDNLVLRAFQQKKYEQRLADYARPNPQEFTLFFTEDADSLPKIKGLNFDAEDAFIVDKLTGRNDTIKYWLKDSLDFKKDSLIVEINYLKSDSTLKLIPAKDTIYLASKISYADFIKPKDEGDDKKKKKKKHNNELANDSIEGGEQKKEKIIEFLNCNVYAPETMDVYDYITFSFNEPITKFDKKAVKLELKVDTLWKDVSFDFERDSIDIKKYNVYADWSPGKEYKMSVDSAAIVGLYGKWNNAISKEIKVKTLDKYGQIFFNVSNNEPKAFVELLNDKGEAVRTVTVENGRADFYYLNPGKYGARLINDSNNNGIWDTGNYEKKIQPEMVYYYPHMIELKANFDVTQTWDVLALPLYKQKPEELKKDKKQR